jgi:Fe-Mn family superoxide dismutase
MNTNPTYTARNFNLSGLHGISDSTLELIRRLGFEYNGTVLHELYFGNLARRGGDPVQGSVFAQAVWASFGSYVVWKTAFASIGKMRSVGWAICFLNPSNGRLSNHWVTLHEIGNVAGFVPLLVMDVWEHAFLLDYKPAERANHSGTSFAGNDYLSP